MGLSSSKQKTKIDQKTTEQATTTPTNPTWVTDPLMDFTNKIRDFSNVDPQSLIAGPSELQQRAWAGGQNLGGWQGQAQQASQLAMKAANAPANLATKTQSYNPAQVFSQT